MILFENSEIIFNFWYVYDETDTIYSLRARAYVGTGSDEEKLAMLKEAAEIDYLIAAPYPIPERYHLLVTEDSKEEKVPVFLASMLKTLDSPIALYEDAIKEIASNIPAQTELEVSANPLCCVTPLLAEADNTLTPTSDRNRRFEDINSTNSKFGK